MTDDVVNHAQIFAWMHPRDLLALARTSKPFRALLMSQSARPFWKASLECVEGLPKCPTYLSEPAFVNLLFFSHCHVSILPAGISISDGASKCVIFHRIA